MSLAGLTATIIATIGGVHLLSKVVSRSDARPRPLRYADVIDEAFGDFSGLSGEVAAPRLKCRAGSGREAPSAAVSGLHRTHSEGGF